MPRHAVRPSHWLLCVPSLIVVHSARPLLSCARRSEQARSRLPNPFLQSLPLSDVPSVRAHRHQLHSRLSSAEKPPRNHSWSCRFRILQATFSCCLQRMQAVSSGWTQTLPSAVHSSLAATDLEWTAHTLCGMLPQNPPTSGRRVYSSAPRTALPPLRSSFRNKEMSRERSPTKSTVTHDATSKDTKASPSNTDIQNELKDGSHQADRQNIAPNQNGYCRCCRHEGSADAANAVQPISIQDGVPVIQPIDNARIFPTKMIHRFPASVVVVLSVLAAQLGMHAWILGYFGAFGR